MEIHVKQCKQRNKRRERAQRMIAERDKDAAAADGTGGNRDPDDSADDDSGPVSREKPHRPPVRRKRKEKEPSPVLEEDIIDGFAILAFKAYEDIEFAIKVGNKRNEKRLSSIVELTTVMVQEEKPPKIIDTTPTKLSEKSLGGGGVPLTNKPNSNSISNSESNHSGSTIPGGRDLAGSNAVTANGGTDWSLHHLQQQQQQHLHHGVVGPGGVPAGDRTPNGDVIAGNAGPEVGLLTTNGTGAGAGTGLPANHHNHLHNHVNHGALHNHHLHHHHHTSRSSQSSQQQQPLYHNHTHLNHHVNLSLSSIIDPGTSDDSGRASERLTTSSVAQRDPDSSRDRLSDASSRCSSGKGYICDSEGDDDKVSRRYPQTDTRTFLFYSLSDIS
uniref:Uncharacterized protein n=1 Tax=Anopheles farauti TaxID=69004 RepID=A0A182QY86_9DIPT